MSRIQRYIGWFVGISVIAGLLVLAVLTLNAYREMRKLETGTMWHLPTRVYSSPFEIFPGMDISRSGLMERLERLRYQRVGEVVEPGQYSLAKGTLTVYLHPFRYPEGEAQAAMARLETDGKRIGRIRSGLSGQSLSAIRLEPEIIATIFDAGFEDREIISLKDCPPYLIDALLCVEDRRFYRHSGVDLRAMVRALLADVFHSRILEGGSTITQQLVKNLFLTHERTLSRKIREIWLALIMEAAFTKDEILAMYLNEIYLGRSGHAGIHGFGRASRVFFDKDVSALELHEAALIVGLIRSPNRHSPYTHPGAALDRRNTVLALMMEQDRLSSQLYRATVREPLGVVPFSPVMRRAPYFTDHVLSTVRSLFPQEEILARGGLGIFTTLDVHAQLVTEDAVSRELAVRPENVQAACVVIRPTDGAILAMVGGREYRSSQYNRAVSLKRNIGSLIKPVVYCAALKNGYTLSSMVDDSPLTVQLKGMAPWSPENYDSVSHGEVMLIDALVNSYNQATVRLGLALGLHRVEAMARAVLPGVRIPGEPSLLLGAAACSPLDVAVMYAVFANGGTRPSAWCLDAVLDDHGAVIYKGGPGPVQRVVDEGACFLVDTALQEVLRRGTARGAAGYGVPYGVCGKTGTTNDRRDSWFAAYTPDLVAVAWMGDDTYRTTGLTGATGALPVACRVMARLAAPVKRDAPPGVTFCEIDPANGRRATMWTASPVTLPFLAGTEPAEASREGLPGVWDALKSLWPFGD